MRALWLDRQDCSHNVSRRMKRSNLFLKGTTSFLVVLVEVRNLESVPNTELHDSACADCPGFSGPGTAGAHNSLTTSTKNGTHSTSFGKTR